jgi:hypothetical protein
MKKIFLGCLIYILSFSCFALSMGTQHINRANGQCAQVTNPNPPGFCKQFESISHCHCSNSSLGGMCDYFSMDDIYGYMIDWYGSQSAACHDQEHDSDGTSYQNCMNYWDTYRSRC